MFERYRDAADDRAEADCRRSRNPREFVFDRVLEDTQLVPALLKADRRRDRQPRRVRRRVLRGVLQRAATRHGGRLNKSIAAVAAMITGAWEAAGKPAVPATSTSPRRAETPAVTPRGSLSTSSGT